jgi:hypothetical protein
MSAVWVLIGIVGVAGVVGALAVVAYLRTDGKKHPLRDLEEQVSAADGRAIRVTYTSEQRDKENAVQPATVRVTAHVDDAHGGEGEGAYRGDGRARAGVRPLFVLRRETRLDRLGERLGFCRKIQTGDPVFDARVHVEADAIGGDVQGVLGNPDFRKAVLDLLNAGTHRVELDGDGLAAARTCREGESPVDPERIEKTAALLTAAASALPLFDAGRVARRRSPLPLGIAVGAVALGGAVLFGKGASFTPVDTGGAIAAGVPAGLVAWALAVLVAARLLRGRSDALHRLGLFAGVALLAIPAGVYGGLLWANGALDASAPVEHRTTVTGKWRTGGGTDRKGAARPSQGGVTVTSWRPGESTRPVISEALYMDAQVGAPVVVTTRAGRLGWEWEVGAPVLGAR